PEVARHMQGAVGGVRAAAVWPRTSGQDAGRFMGEGTKMTTSGAFAKNGRTLGEAAVSAATREFVRYYEQDPIRHTTAFAGVAEVVAKLDRLGLRQGVCTNKFERPARASLGGLKRLRPIAAVAGAAD